MDDIKNRKEMMEHIKNDVDYPASKQDLVSACDGMSDVPEGDKKFFSEKLPDRTFSTPEEVLSALGAV